MWPTTTTVVCFDSPCLFNQYSHEVSPRLNLRRKNMLTPGSAGVSSPCGRPESEKAFHHRPCRLPQAGRGALLARLISDASLVAFKCEPELSVVMATQLTPRTHYGASHLVRASLFTSGCLSGFKKSAHPSNLSHRVRHLSNSCALSEAVLQFGVYFERGLLSLSSSFRKIVCVVPNHAGQVFHVTNVARADWLHFYARG